jgi:excisionase family DNA binding protein
MSDTIRGGFGSSGAALRGLSVREAAEWAGVSESLVYGWIASGMLPHYRLGASGRRGKISIRVADLETLVETMRQGGRARTPCPAPYTPKHFTLD